MDDKVFRPVQSVSPVGWYVGTYQLRFFELHRADIDDESARFLVWENTVLVKAASPEEAFDKVASIGREQHTEPYKGGEDGVEVQWRFEGVVEILPVYEEIEDGCELMWAEKPNQSLRQIKARTLTKERLFASARSNPEAPE